MLENPYHELLKSLLNQGKSIKVTVRGMSMFPILLTNDVVLVKPAESDDLKFGQIIVFRLGYNFVVHRLIGKNNEKGLVFTRGDGLPKKDKPVKLEDVVGVVVGIEQSRWRLAKLAIGRWSPVWAVVMPIVGPFIRVFVKIYVYFKSFRRF
jgi:signal peptidase I